MNACATPVIQSEADKRFGELIPINNFTKFDQKMIPIDAGLINSATKEIVLAFENRHKSINFVLIMPLF